MASDKVNLLIERLHRKARGTSGYSVQEWEELIALLELHEEMVPMKVRADDEGITLESEEGEQIRIDANPSADDAVPEDPVVETPSPEGLASGDGDVPQP